MRMAYASSPEVSSMTKEEVGISLSLFRSGGGAKDMGGGAN